uniref:Apple domain-containing protein n=1 Tax=Quercus lobata TaxID=97700 RepID=A0A7N2LPV5_QUELO
MANRIRKLILGLLCLLFYLGPSSSQSSHDTLVQGEKLEYFTEKYSAGGGFRIGFTGFAINIHVLLPGMKLGVDQKTGQRRLLTSWRSQEVPDPGNFTFGLRPNRTDQLVILLNGDIYWTSGYVNVNSSSFRLANSNYSFEYTSNENETFFSYSATDINHPPLSINYLGVLSDENGAMVNCTSASSYLNEGCVAKENLQCRSLNETFSGVFGSWHDIDGFKFNEGDNLTLMDCKAKCLSNCSCVAYASTNEENQTGCEISTIIQ